MKVMDVNGVLAQIRAINAGSGAAEAAPAPPVDRGAGFADALKAAVQEVNAAQQDAGAKSAAFAAGDPQLDITEVMLALNRSQVSFKAMSEVRNRLVSAYQDIMNMPI